MRAMTLITVCIAALVYGSASFELGFRYGSWTVRPPPTFEDRFGNWHNRPFHRWHPILPLDPGRSLYARMIAKAGE
jgi:hypothetical protein